LEPAMHSVNKIFARVLKHAIDTSIKELLSRWIF